MTDSNILTALSHPLRRRLMDVLQADGPGTVTMLADRTTERVPNISHHVRVLAQAGLVVEAPELARDRRERWWRPAGTEGRPERVERWCPVVGCRRERPGNSAFFTERWLHLTPAELADLSQEVVDLLRRWSSCGEPDDAGREPVLVFAYGGSARR